MDKFDDAQNVKIGRALSLDGKCICGFLKIFLHMFPHFKRRLILVAHINIDSIDQYCNAFSCTNTINISNYDIGPHCEMLQNTIFNNQTSSLLKL